MGDVDVILRLENIEKSYSGVRVLSDVTLTLRKGSILALVGENGAGKSTLMNILGGITPKDGGSMFLFEEEYWPAKPQDAVKNGIAFIHQELNMFTNLTVAENIFIDHFPQTLFKRIIYKKMHTDAKAILDRLDEKIDPQESIGNLPLGSRQMVEIGKALARDTKIIIFDEPTTSLSNKEKEKLFSIIQELNHNGVSIIYISHMLEDVFRLCDEIVVLRDGKLIVQDRKDNLSNTDVVRMMVGRELSKLYPYAKKKTGPPFLSISNLCQTNKLWDISFTLHQGEVVGLFGLMGAGRSELVRAIFGVDTFDSGAIFFKGEEISNPNPESWIERGVALITENRREEGLMMPKSVQENLVLAHLKKLQGPLNSISRKSENAVSTHSIEQLKIKTFNKDKQSASMLSGGNQQKVVLGKWLMNLPEVFLMDEPTRGVDVGAKYEIYTYMNELVTNGSSILFISSEMEELMGVCDRILIMCNGHISGELHRDKFNSVDLLNLAIKGDKTQ